MTVKASQLLAAASLRRWTQVRRFENLACVLFEYLCIALLHAGTLFVFSHRAAWGWPAWVELPIGAVTVIVTGILIHRIGLLGHESSHNLLAPDRFWNDVLANLLCFFPLWSSLSSYRAKHSGHHLHPNDPDHDPNWAGDKAAELYARFPMPRPSFIFQYYLKFFWPPFVFRNLIDLAKVLSVGSSPRNQKPIPWYRSTAVLGLLHLSVLVGLIFWSENAMPPALVLVVPVAYHLAVLGIMMSLPRSFYQTGAVSGLAYDRKSGAMFRLSFHACVFFVLCALQAYAGLPATLYYVVFWILPLVYVFPYLMLLREVYQHANLGRGKLDNSRIIHADPFTVWAVLAYGNDLHLVHHIYPNIPHYHLSAAHEELMETSEAYRSQLEETVGTFRAPDGKRSLLDSLAEARGA
jgi:fatty acid desaturase